MHAAPSPPAAGCWRRGSRLTPCAHSPALVALLALCSTCTYESFAQAKQHKRKKKKGPHGTSRIARLRLSLTCRPRLPSELCKGAFTSQLSNQSPPSLPPCTKSRYTLPIASASLVQVAHDPYRERVILYTNPANARGVVLHVATIFPNNGHARHFPACSKK